MRLVGLHRPMSFDGGQLAMEEVGALWRDFRSRISEVEAGVGPDFISMRIYEEPLASAPSADSRFEQWAAVEVSEFGDEVAGSRRTLNRSGAAVAPGRSCTPVNRMLSRDRPEGQERLSRSLTLHMPHVIVPDRPQGR